MRLLPTDIIRNSGCSLMELMHIPVETETKYVNDVILKPCVKKILRGLAVKKNYLHKYKAQTMSNALAFAAHQISQYQDMYVSPFSVRAAQFGLDAKMVKPDDITVIVDYIVEKEENEIADKGLLITEIDVILGELKEDILTYLLNTASEPNYYVQN